MHRKQELLLNVYTEVDDKTISKNAEIVFFFTPKNTHEMFFSRHLTKISLWNVFVFFFRFQSLFMLFHRGKQLAAEIVQMDVEFQTAG